MVQRRAYHDHHHLSQHETDIAHRATMDFLPKAKGSWQELNEHRQKINNGTLALGIVVFVSSIVGVSRRLDLNLIFKNIVCFFSHFFKFNRPFRLDSTITCTSRRRTTRSTRTSRALALPMLNKPVWPGERINFYF